MINDGDMWKKQKNDCFADLCAEVNNKLYTGVKIVKFIEITFLKILDLNCI